MSLLLKNKITKEKMIDILKSFEQSIKPVKYTASEKLFKEVLKRLAISKSQLVQKMKFSNRARLDNWLHSNGFLTEQEKQGLVNFVNEAINELKGDKNDN